MWKADEGLVPLLNAHSRAACHVPSFTIPPGSFVTADGETVDVVALQDQVISPYSDFLLHDMGPELDNGVTLGSAESSEYRTIPLWDLWFRENFLHNGRAANLRQATLFHGREASAATIKGFWKRSWNLCSSPLGTS